MHTSASLMTLYGFFTNFLACWLYEPVFILKYACIDNLRKLLLLTMGSIFILFTAQSQPVRRPVNISHGFDSERIQRLDQVINNAITNGEIPGAVILIMHNGQVAYHKSFGYSDIASKKMMELNSIFRIASMTKAITTIGVMILYERGHFLLNDPISKYIPEFKNPQILIEADSTGNIIKTEPSKKEIRIIDLLTHTSGLSYKFIPNQLQKVYERDGILDAITEKDITLAEQMKKLSRLPLLFEPSSKYHYGLSIDLLGYLCEVISKKSLDQFLKDEIFSPLKMFDTHFYLPPAKEDRLVKLYSWIDSKGLIEAKGNESSIKIDNVRFPVEGARTYFSGGGGLSSTVHDYSRLTQMMLNQGELDGIRLLGRKTVELMITPRVDVNNDKIPELGLGGLQIINNIADLGELGSNGAYMGGGAFYGTYLIDPKENLTMVFMSQIMPAKTDVANKFRIMVYQALVN